MLYKSDKICGVTYFIASYVPNGYSRADGIRVHTTSILKIKGDALLNESHLISTITHGGINIWYIEFDGLASSMS